MSDCWGTENVHSWEVQIRMAAQSRLRWGRVNDLQVEVTYFPLEKLAGLIPPSQQDWDILLPWGKKGNYQGAAQTLFPRDSGFSQCLRQGQAWSCF